VKVNPTKDGEVKKESFQLGKKALFNKFSSWMNWEKKAKERK
jgi:hypothetical protein